jgi:hypothetical protein
MPALQPKQVFSFSSSSPQARFGRDEIELSQFGSYFFRMPVSVLLRLFTALFAAGVFTAADEDDPPAGLA